jgi:glycosyltransferase involved in cell wall biosynthesis
MDRPKRIFLETAKLKNLNSGLGQFCLQLGGEISRLNTDFDLTFFVPPSQEFVFGREHKYVIYNNWRRIVGISAEADLWHCFYQGTPYWPKNDRTKVVLTIHDLNFIYKYSGWKLKGELNKLQRQVTLAHSIVTISEYTKAETLRHLKVDEKKISVIYNGLSKASGEGVKPAVVPDSKFFFSLGIITSKKNFHVLIPFLKESNKILVIAGDKESDYARQIISQAKTLGVSEQVILTGVVSEDEKNWLYRNCEAFLFPSIAEGFGLPVIEAMSYGKPVFCSNLTSLPEIGGPHAYYFSSFDPHYMADVVKKGMDEYYSNPQKEVEIKKWASRFSWEGAAKDYLKIYNSLLRD